MDKRKKKQSNKTAVIVAIGGGEPMIFEPIPQRTPLQDKQSEWEQRKFNYDHPYRHQNIGQRVYGEAVRFRLDPKFMTDAGVNVSTEDKTYIIR
jgi:hypothetical protein